MPPIGHEPPAQSDSHSQPPDPNHPSTSQSHRSESVSHQAAPGIVASASHISTHVLPRRFLGPMPEAVVNSAEVEERHRRLRAVRRVAARRMSNVGDAGRAIGQGRRRVVGKIKDIRRGSEAGPESMEVDLDSEEEEEEKRFSRKKKKKRKDVWVGESFDIGREFRSEQVREADHGVSSLSAVRDGGEGSSIPPASPVMDDRGEGPSRAASAPTRLDRNRDTEEGAGKDEKRPAASRATTQDSFVTARTQFSDARTNPESEQEEEQDGGTTEDDAGDGAKYHYAELSFSAEPNGFELNGLNDDGPVPGPSSINTTSPTMRPSTSRQSGTSSIQALISDRPPLSASPVQSTLSPRDKDKDRSKRSYSPTSPASVSGLRTRLKSAIRPARTQTEAAAGGANGKDDNRAYVKAKTVQFPVELEQDQEPGAVGSIKGSYRGPTLRNGFKRPVDPEDVLARQGEETRGTSAAAVQDAMEDGDEDAFSPGQVMMRDRVLVRVGYNREDNLMDYDEAMQKSLTKQRRKPCSRMEAMQELIMVWRRGRVEFYEEWKTPLKERLVGHKKLAYMVPLNPTRSSLIIFNETDLTISLTTSAAKLSDDLDRALDSTSTRTGAIKSRLKDSAQGKWLLSGRKGTHVFIVKFAERTRAMDWYWELWREFEGELPRRLDVVVPAFNTTIRLGLPKEEESVGCRATCAAFSPAKVSALTRDAIKDAVDTDRLLRQRQESREAGGQSGHGKFGNDDFQLELAWKSADGRLEWMCWDRTVRDRKRDWGVLAGLAKLQDEKQPRQLQLRPASHRVKALRLEDGTVLDEPSGVEGYLTRHTGGSSAKEQVYASTHDGYIFLSTRSNAQPPLDPGDEGATPSDIFPDVHDMFMEAEKRRMAKLIEHSTGCVDLRDIQSIRLLTDPEADDDEDGPKGASTIATARQTFKGKNIDQWFEVKLVHGAEAQMKTAIFEAQGEETAKEWVERLKELSEYWKHRHRVDARLRMDVEKMHAASDPFAGSALGNQSDAMLSDLWDWCVLRGCRSVCMSGRLFLRKGKWSKFRSRLIVLTGGCLVAFKLKPGEPLAARKQRYPLYGAYTYSGMLALEELHDSAQENAFVAQARVYQDGLQNTDGIEDRTFCIRLATKPSWWGKNRTYPWDTVGEKGWAALPLSGEKPPFLLIFRARSKLERDRWVWAINAEMERQVRANVSVEDKQRHYGVVP